MIYSLLLLFYISPQAYGVVTDAQAEILFAQLFPFGDPAYPLSTTDPPDLDADLCLVHRTRENQIVDYIAYKYPLNLIMQIAIRVGFYDVGAKNDDYCSTPANRYIFISNASVINPITAMNGPRLTYMSNLLNIYYANTGLTTIGLLCCSTWPFVSGLISAAPTPASQFFLQDMINAFIGTAFRSYLCVLYPEGSSQCTSMTFPGPPSPAQPPYTSVFQGAQYVLSKVTSLSGIIG